MWQIWSQKIWLRRHHKNKGVKGSQRRIASAKAPKVVLSLQLERGNEVPEPYPSGAEEIPEWLGRSVESWKGGRYIASGSFACEGERKELRNDTGTLDPILGGQRCCCLR